MEAEAAGEWLGHARGTGSDLGVGGGGGGGRSKAKGCAQSGGGELHFLPAATAVAQGAARAGASNGGRRL